MSLKYSENCVYAIATLKGVKIGFTSRLGDRLSAFQKQHQSCCYPFLLIIGLTRKEAVSLEKSLHKMFASYHIDSEYFEYDVTEHLSKEFAKHQPISPLELFKGDCREQ